MPERFIYAADLSQTFLRQRRRRLVVWFLILVPLLVISAAVLANGPKQDRWVVVSVVFLFVTIWVICEWCLRVFATRTLALAKGLIEVDESVVRQLNDADGIVAQVDLTEPYQVGYGRYVMGSAIYHVRQGATVVEFSSSVQGAERLVRETLKHNGWPPGHDL